MTTLLKRLIPTGTDELLKAPVLIAFATLFLFIHALIVDVVIHPFFFTVDCFVLLLIPGGALSSVALWRIARKRNRIPVGPGGVLALLCLPFFLAVVYWLVLAKTPAWIAAIAFGTPHSEVREFDIGTFGGKGCRSRARPVDDLRLQPHYLCVTEDFADQYDRQRVQLRLQGERTPLGFRIAHFEHVAANGVPPQ